jgi:hypothetical protein
VLRFILETAFIMLVGGEMTGLLSLPHFSYTEAPLLILVIIIMFFKRLHKLNLIVI